ncbi:hypothetical protein ACIA6C_05105 [Streptomyces sp. NPDC051578]
MISATVTDGEPNDTAAPRTAVGFTRDGRRLRLVAVDRRAVPRPG